MLKCHLCGAGEISLRPSYEPLHRVTSDCKPWPPGGQLGVCPQCGGAQAVIGPQWEAEARKIYDNYTIYHQGGGAEQSVFDVATGALGWEASVATPKGATELERIADVPDLIDACRRERAMLATSPPAYTRSTLVAEDVSAWFGEHKVLDRVKAAS